MSPTGIVTNIQRCSTEDGPGIRTTVFFKGCPLHCVWCHNIETIDAQPILVWYSTKCIADESCLDSCPEAALTFKETGLDVDHERCNLCGKCIEVCPTGALHIMGMEWDSEDLIKELLKDKVFFETSGGGVTLSGGEATYQASFLIAIAKGLKEEGIHVALDTCGYCSPEILERFLPFIDLVLFDIKQMDETKHKEQTGVPLKLILDNAVLVHESGCAMWIRTPIIPGHTDSVENIQSIAEFILSKLPTVHRFELLAFNKMCSEKYSLFGLEYPLKDVGLVSKEKMEHLVSVAREAGISNVYWSGMAKRPIG